MHPNLGIKYKYKYSTFKYKYEYKYLESVLEYKYKYQVLHLCLKLPREKLNDWIRWEEFSRKTTPPECLTPPIPKLGT